MVIENLTTKQQQDVLRTLLYYMQPDLRRKIMVAHPVAYVRMAPHTGSAVLERVRQAIAIEEEVGT